MFDLLKDLAHVFYGLPLLLASTAFTLSLVFFVVLPIKKFIDNSPRLRSVKTDDFMFKTHLSLPISLLTMSVLGVNVFAFVNVLQAILSLSIFPN